MSDDAALIHRFLSKAENIHFDTEHAELVSSGIDFLGKKKFDIILSDLGLPDSMGVETFMKFHSLYPDIPVIMLTGLDDENTALRAVQSGAQDYLIKGQINTSQLIRSIQYSIERQKLIVQLEKSLKEIKTLRGLLPICAWCRKIRDDKGYWKGLEAYIQEHTDAAFTHGICPKCMKKVSIELHKNSNRGKVQTAKNRKTSRKITEERSQNNVYGEHTMKVLIVEDDENHRLLTCLDLREENWDIITASNGKEAMILFEKEHPDIVTLDIKLPDINGSKLLKKMKEKRPAIPIIMLTGCDNHPGVSEADTYIVKTLSCGKKLKRSIKKLTSAWT